MKKKKKSDNKCKYCQTWYDIPSNKRTYSSNKLIQFRHCPKIKKDVEASDEACIYFTLAKRFWCLKDVAWLDIKMCIARRKNKAEGCSRCSQGKQIEKMMEKK